MSKRITPFASQNTVAITLAADLCTLNFLVTGEDGCFQVMESRFVSGVFRWTQVSSPVIRLSKRLLPISQSVMGYFMNCTLWNFEFQSNFAYFHPPVTSNSSSTQVVFSSLVDVFGRPDFGSSPRLARPSPNRVHH
ncbi:hypothetical protein PoB_000140600 [Plakobranchus ocellatus]|uniref:Uncharacterized protein n=1 Tax=Plakobranchus ocellatus TaxID=259542 RepID=A0AAV3X090_9GAST|nr:hypothetical protein PoB_000140600 [Plakobranchus ocellatus]